MAALGPAAHHAAGMVKEVLNWAVSERAGAVIVRDRLPAPHR